MRPDEPSRNPNTHDPDGPLNDPIEAMLDAFVADEHRRTSPSREQTEALVRRVRSASKILPLSEPTPSRPSVKWWSWAAALPLLVGGTFWVVSQWAVAPILESDLEVVEMLDELQLLNGFPMEDLADLDVDDIVPFLENLELLDQVDPQLLEEEG